MDVEVGEQVECQHPWIQDTYQKGILLCERQNNTKPFYIRFTELDKRYDMWVASDRIRKCQNNPFDAKKVTRKQIAGPSEKSALFENPVEQMLEAEHQERTKIKFIEQVTIGKYTLDTWYASPYPMEFGQLSHIYVCQRCLKYMRKPKTLKTHLQDPCALQGTQIYADSNIIVMRVSGSQNKLYCQNLSLFAKLFIDHKVLYFDVKDYEYFVLMTTDQEFVGYFSRLRNTSSINNLSCIVILPPYQNLGYGTFLIELSYQISKDEGRICTPETPLSEMGRVLYMSYWKRQILSIFYQEMVDSRAKKRRAAVQIESIKQISQLTMIAEADILVAMKELNLVRYYKKDYILIQDRAAINRIVRSKFKAVQKCPFNPDLLM